MKKGFTLIELVIGLSIQALIMGLGIKGAVIAIDRYETHKSISQEEDKIDEALLNINRYMTKNMIENIKINEVTNEINIKIREFHSKDFYITKKIRLDNDKKLILESYNNTNFRTAVNVILRDVEKFDLIKKENLHYLVIKTFKGGERVVCL